MTARLARDLVRRQSRHHHELSVMIEARRSEVEELEIEIADLRFKNESTSSKHQNQQAGRLRTRGNHMKQRLGLGSGLAIFAILRFG